MKRRTFVKQSSLAGLAFACVPTKVSYNDTTYSIDELMGKATIDLYGEGINLRKEAHDAYVAMKKAAYADGLNNAKSDGALRQRLLTELKDKGMTISQAQYIADNF